MTYISDAEIRAMLPEKKEEAEPAKSLTKRILAADKKIRGSRRQHQRDKEKRGDGTARVLARRLDSIRGVGITTAFKTSRTKRYYQE